MKRTVLIIEDNNVDIALLSGYLKDKYNVIEAKTGKKGLAEIEKNFKTLSAIFLDLVMPEMNGFEVLSEIKGNANWNHIPVIVTTTLSDEESLDTAFRLGATTYITKPYNQKILLAILSNIVSLCERAAASLSAYKDKLTGLYNRETFFTEASKLIQSHERGYYILSYLNIEHFKVINDQYGHELGDKVLKHVGECLHEVELNLSGLASRVTDDNFALLFPAKAVETKELKSLHKKCANISFLTQPITVRVGRYHIKEKALPIYAMFDRAILAEDSIQGKYNFYITEYDDSMKENLIHEQKIVSTMEDALKNKEFEAWYQPQYNHGTGCVIGAEALVRWRDPKDGHIIPPYQFIPVFEKNGFIYELDKYVWEEVCIQLRKWLDAGETVLPVSVNISRVDIFHAELKDVIIKLIKKYKIPINLLRLEITESAFSESKTSIIETVKALIDYGFTVEIDDFGSGYSSLNTLKDVPAQILKLDMKFFEGDKNVERGDNIIESIVRMAKWIGMAVIAEGVEVQEQADYLKSIGCYYIQGYYYAKPMPLNEYEALLAKEKKETNLNRLTTVKELNNNRFWDPESMDTLVFNSYIGGACIFEYHNNKTELLRTNDRYVKVLGKFAPSNNDLINQDLIRFLDDKEKNTLYDLIKYSIETKSELSAELKLTDPLDVEKVEFVRVTARVIAFVDTRYLFYCVVENCTEQKKALLLKEELEEKKQETTNRLQLILDNSPCGITAIVLGSNATTRYVYVNQKFFDLVGYTEEQFNKEVKNGFDLISPKDIKEFKEKVCALNTVGQSLDVDVRAIRRDGSETYLRGSINVVRMENVDNPVQLASFYDISISKENEEHLRFLSQSAHEIILHKDSGEAITKILENAVQYFDGDRAYVMEFNEKSNSIDKSYECCALNIKEGKKAVKNVSSEVIETLRKELKQRKYCIVDKEKIDNYCKSIGTVRPIKLKSVMLTALWSRGVLVGFTAIDNPRDSNKSIENLITMCDYISFLLSKRDSINYTERTEENLLSVVLSEVIKKSPDMMYVKDLDLKYVAASPSSYSIVGCKSEKEMIGKTDKELFAKELAEKYYKDDSSIIKTKQPILNGFDVIVTNEGAVHSVNSNKFPILDSMGKVIGLYGISRDITKVKEDESKLRILSNTIPGGIVSFEYEYGEYRTLYINDEFFRNTGYSRKEYLDLSEDDPFVLIHKEDRSQIENYIKGCLTNKNVNKVLRCECRCQNKKGKYHWYSIRCSIDTLGKNYYRLNAILINIDELKESEEQLRISEQEYILASQMSENLICRYSLQDKTLTISPMSAKRLSWPEKKEHIPYGTENMEAIDPETKDAYFGFYESILNGEKNGSAIFHKLLPSGWRWVSAKFSTIFDKSNNPISAIVSLTDITDMREKEITFEKWKQNFKTRSKDSYSLFCSNVTKKSVYDKREGNLLQIGINSSANGFDLQTENYVKNFVCEEDAKSFSNFLNIDELMKKYIKGKYHSYIDYKEKTKGKEYRWLRLTIDLIKIPDTEDIECHMLFENIDKEKRAEIKLLTRAEKDSLTNVYNRIVFTEKVNEIIKKSNVNSQHALLMLDIDNFKKVNDVFGHAEGDKTLIDIARLLESMSRSYDLVGRLGGDEFVVFLQNIPNDIIAAKRAKAICEKTQKTFAKNIHISSSVGISIYPRNGNNFDELYKNADKVLYSIKDSGRNNFAFFGEAIENRVLYSKDTHYSIHKKPHILIVEDNPVDYTLLSGIFDGSYVVEKATDGEEAIEYLERYGHSISIILLDLMMPKMNGFEVLERMQSDVDLKSIPVIVVSSDVSRDTTLKAIRLGATDFVPKPIDSISLLQRVHYIMESK